jgi:hypothetical protein
MLQRSADGVVAVSRSVKHAQYEIFWLSHHFFIVFYAGLIFHGPVFVYWVILPVVLYVGERLWRIKRSQRPVYLKTIKWIAPVLELRFCPKFKDDIDFVEGQYVYLNCPFLSLNEVRPRVSSRTVRGCCASCSAVA